VSLNNLGISYKHEKLLIDLSNDAYEIEAMCTTAPNIWDAETPEDIQLAKQGCNGTPKNRISHGTPPCPLRERCLEVALEVEADHCVWGGKSAYERKVIATRRKRAAENPPATN
jgi:hypothetical protein